MDVKQLKVGLKRWSQHEPKHANMTAKMVKEIFGLRVITGKVAEQGIGVIPILEDALVESRVSNFKRF